MNKIKSLISLIFILLTISSSLNAAEKEKPLKLIFTPIIISGGNQSGHLPDEVSMIIQKYLLEEDFFLINDKFVLTDEITFNNCLKKQCAAQLKAITPEGIVILISVITTEVKIGEKKLSRYIVEDITETRYTVNVSTVDIQKEKYDLVYTSTFNNTVKLLDYAESTGEKIRDYYIKRKPAVRADAAAAEKGKASTDFYDITGVSLNLSMIYPFGRMSDIADYGYGYEIALNGLSKIFPYITINPGFSSYSMVSSNSNIKFAYMFLPELTFGYNIALTEKISLSPIAGIGYSLMLVDGKRANNPGSTGTNLYYNPEFKAGLEASYTLSEDYSLLFKTTICSIAERSSMLLFSSFNLGIRVNLK